MKTVANSIEFKTHTNLLLAHQQRIAISFVDFDKKTVCNIYPAVQDIVLIKANNVYSNIVLHDSCLKMLKLSSTNLHVAKPLIYFENILGAYGFCRVHKSYLVNVLQVLLYQENGFLYLHQIPAPIKVADDKRKTLKQALGQICVQ